MEASATGSLITVKIDGKPLEKLIEVVSNGIGTLYRPRKIRKEADAQAYAIKVLEKAKAEAGADSMLIEADTAERISQRLVAKEIRRQNNIDTVVEAAAEDLKGKEVSDEPVNEDWSTRFFGIVQDVSQKEMKAIWAKILAKEIEKPSSFGDKGQVPVTTFFGDKGQVPVTIHRLSLQSLNQSSANSCKSL